MEYFPCGSKIIVLYDIHRVMLDNINFKNNSKHSETRLVGQMHEFNGYIQAAFIQHRLCILNLWYRLRMEVQCKVHIKNKKNK